ncbi:MAG: hypothetical protein CMP91_13410 [Gammaproteobacteria bacterium]|nr:hypothetical protein [Gammaproteobacteria bacterium]MAY02062.1 hypothetical protein [Gammaproteobacteria bacterium]|tara:strand:- start:214 stop:876 length:663 start_codon:yes stop_codon:yes gene_type:complete
MIKTLPASCLNALKLFTGSIILFSASTLAQPQSDTPEFSSLFQQLEENIALINELDSEITENTRLQNEIRARSDQLNTENSELEQITSEYNQALEALNADINTYIADCDGQALSNEALSQCEARRLRLEDRNLQLTNQAGQITAREEQYNQQVEEINASEQARALAAQQLFIRRAGHLNTIDDIFQQLQLINPLFQNCAALIPNAMLACVSQVQSGPVLP